MGQPALTNWRPEDVALTQLEVNPELVLEGSPEWSIAVAWANEDKTMMSGCFRSTPGRFKFVAQHAEIALVRAGHVVITTEDGTSEDFRAGDVISVNAGASLVFDVRETLEDTWVQSSNVPIEA